MRSRFYTFAVTALFAAATAVPALAQAPNLDPPNSEAPKPPEIYARTEHTVGWMKLTSNADDVIKETDKVIAGE